MQGKGEPLPLQPIPKTKNNNKTKTNNKIKVVYTEDWTHPRPALAAQTAGSPHGPWRLANSPALSLALPVAYFDALGLPRLLDAF